MNVCGWIDYEEVEIWMEKSFGGLGGFFSDGMRWHDYVGRFTKDGKEYAEALRSEIVKRNIQYTGQQHQNSSEGVPVFCDGTIATFSFRAWGDLMAAVWSEEENKDYSYMDFYM